MMESGSRYRVISTLVAALSDPDQDAKANRDRVAFLPDASSSLRANTNA